jgi:hypothetical protein
MTGESEHVQELMIVARELLLYYWYLYCIWRLIQCDLVNGFACDSDLPYLDYHF